MSVETDMTCMWGAEGTAGTNVITATNSLAWKFGIHGLPWEATYSTKKVAPNYYDSLLPDSHTVRRSEVMKGMAFWPCNGVMWYYFLGKSTNAGDDNEHDLAIKADGVANPTFSWRSEQTGGTTPTYTTAVGCVVQSIQETYSFMPAGNPGRSAVQIFGIKDDPADELGSAHQGAVEPTNDYTLTGTARTDMYKKDSNMIFKWNTNDKKAQLMNMQIAGAKALQGYQADSTSDIGYLFGDTSHIEFTFDVFRGIDNDFVADFKTETARAIQFRIYNTANRYKDYQCTNAVIENITASHDPNMGAEAGPRFLRVQAKADKTFAIEVKDGLDDVFYTDP
jgi:hypothetical protein